MLTEYLQYARHSSKHLACLEILSLNSLISSFISFLISILHSSVFLLLLLIFIGVELIYNVVLVSSMMQSIPDIHIYIFTFFRYPSHLDHHGALGRVPFAI